MQFAAAERRDETIGTPRPTDIFLADALLNA
jgi:hypothetical protein